jgi:hypothetical protein
MYTPYVLKSVISQRNAATVYATSNHTILDIYDLSEAKPTNYTPEMFLQITDAAFSINQTGDSPNAVFDTMLQLGSVNLHRDNGSITWMSVSVELVAHLQRILAVSVLVFNENFFQGVNGGLPPFQNSSLSGALVTPISVVNPRFASRLN